jgi:hypothetical protein
MSKDDTFLNVKSYVYSVYPFLIQNKPIFYKYKSDIKFCIETYLMENSISVSEKKINLMVIDILNNYERMKYLLDDGSIFYDLLGNEVRQANTNEKYYAGVRIKELKIENDEKSIDIKIGILMKKINEIQQWKNEFIKSNNKINERIERLRIDEERIKEKRQELNFEISKFKVEKNRIEQQKISSGNLKIGKYLRDHIIQTYLDEQKKQETSHCKVE